MYWMYRHLLFKSRMERRLQILSWNLVFTNNRNDPPPSSSQRPLPPHLIENNNFVLRYVLVDGIYPKWSCFLGPISSPTTLSEKNYTLLQSARRKDIERAFGVLKIKFNILNKPSLTGNISLMNRTLRVCTILHNMVNTRHMYDWRISHLLSQVVEEKRLSDKGEYFTSVADAVENDALDALEADQETRAPSELTRIPISIGNPAAMFPTFAHYMKHLNNPMQHSGLMRNISTHLWKNVQLSKTKRRLQNFDALLE